jgi:hypothetical protein
MSDGEAVRSMSPSVRLSEAKISTSLNAANASHTVIERCDVCDLIERAITRFTSRATAGIWVRRFICEWRASRNKTTNPYVIEIAI